MSNTSPHSRQVLVTGAGGFIGSALTTALLERGHRVVACHRHPDERGPAPGLQRIAADFLQDLTPQAWIPRLQGVEVVVNTVGILRERHSGDFDRIHRRAPQALLQACQSAGVHRFIQISALGADADASSQYHRSKFAGDQHLRDSDLAWTILQPSVVFGPGGASSRLFTTLASLPLIPLIGTGDQWLQPIHLDDLIRMLVRLVEQPQHIHETIPAVGPKPVPLRRLLPMLRAGMGQHSTLRVPIPRCCVRLAARLGDLSGRGPLSSETLQMLLAGNTADPAATATLLGRSPRACEDFIGPQERTGWRRAAIGTWFKPLARIALAVIWIAAGLFSWWFHQELGLRLLAGLGLPGPLVVPGFAAACVVNVLLGVTSLLSSKPWLWYLQILVILIYSLGLTLVAPQLWADPFGPLLKNLPILLLLAGLAADEEAH